MTKKMPINGVNAKILFDSNQVVVYTDLVQ